MFCILTQSSSNLCVNQGRSKSSAAELRRPPLSQQSGISMVDLEGEVSKREGPEEDQDLPSEGEEICRRGKWFKLAEVKDQVSFEARIADF